MAWIANTPDQHVLTLAALYQEPYITLAHEHPLCCARFSPQADKLAYVVESNPPRLVILDAAQPNTPLHELMFGTDAVLLNLAWQDADTLWLNSVNMPTNAGILQGDMVLWRVDADQGDLTQLSEDGLAFPAPDGAHVARYFAGIYGEREAQLQIITAQDEVVQSLNFPAVSSGSHLPWWPSLGWLGNGGVRFILPPSDWLYQAPGTPQATQLVGLSPNDGATYADGPMLSFPLQVLWGPSAEYYAYVGAGRLVIAQADGPTVHEKATPGGQFIDWGTELLFLTDEAELLIWDVSEAQPRVRPNVRDVAYRLDGGLITLEQVDQIQYVTVHTPQDEAYALGRYSPETDIQLARGIQPEN